jgi:hypothetical protein
MSGEKDNKRAGEMTRRGFLKVGGGMLVGSLVHAHGCGDGSSSGGSGSTPVLMTGRVIHVHSSQATNWDFGQDYYGRFVDQAVVDAVVDTGVMELTGKRSVKSAWRRLIPDYAPGKAVAIKVNFNNSPGCGGCETGCADNELQSDALMEPVNAVIRGLVGIGVAEQDIWIYDSSRRIASRFISRCLYGNVRYFDSSCNDPAKFVSPDPDAQIAFSPPAPIPQPSAQEITDVVVNASYLINMPIVKKHGGAGVTLGFKNHFGTITRCSDLHDYVFPGGAYYTDTYNPLVDIHLNPHIANKTVLVIGDGLFGNRITQSGKPQRWTTFGDSAPNSLLFAADPVAADCVMCDLLAAEATIATMSDDYLVLAGGAGLGTFERGDPWLQPYGSGYNDILYIRRDI